MPRWASKLVQSRPSSQLLRTSAASTIILFLLICWTIPLKLGVSDNVEVLHQEGISHGFLVLRSLEGKTLAAGDLIQVVKGRQVTTELVFHFEDGSVHDEITEFSQEHAFRLIRDHLVQKGPSFPHPIDILIDAKQNLVTFHSDEKGKEEDKTEHMELPEDVSNGLVMVLVKNLSPSAAERKVSFLSASSKPRLVHLSIRPSEGRVFKVAQQAHKSTDYDIKVEIGGMAGAVAGLLGKKPPDTHIWMSTGTAPTFIRSEGPLYEGGPIWRTELASLSAPEEDSGARTSSSRADQK